MKNTNGFLVALGCVLMLAAVPIAMLLGIAIGGFVVQTLWGWFLTPLGLPAIGLLHAAGISTLFNYMCPFVDTTNLARKEGTTNGAALASTLLMAVVVRPAFVLAGGAFIHWMM